MTERVVVIDFETTGLHPFGGDRAIEVAAVEIAGDKIGRRYSSLINPGRSVGTFITDLTGITNAMLCSAPSPREVIGQLMDFVGTDQLVAHNAHFDRDFLLNESKLHGLSRQDDFLCTIRIARRVYPKCPSYRLEVVAGYADVPMTGQYHRALADAELTARLFVTMCRDIKARHRASSVPISVLKHLQEVTIARADDWLRHRLSKG